MSEKLGRLQEMLAEIFDISKAIAVLGWDQQTYMPQGGAQGRAMQLATLSRLAHEKFTSPELGEAIEAAKSDVSSEDPDSDAVRLVQKTERDYLKQVKVPSTWVAEYAREAALAHPVWEKARAEADFAPFLPHLERIVRLRCDYANFFAPYDHIYDPLLDDFEPGMKTAQVQAVFEQLRSHQIDLVQKIADDGRPVDDSVLHQSYDVQRQWDFGMGIIREIGFDFERGRQDKSVHPFTTEFGVDDVRITTRFDPNFLNTALFGTLHEAGHGMYAQGIAPTLDRSPLADGASLAVHESQSRMWENLVGRSRAFWTRYLPRLKKSFPEALGAVELEDFYRAINKVERSFIRVEADEATYNLHIMVRFELEIALMEGSLAVADLPAAWNEKFEEFFGLVPPDDAQGLLQDVHWSGGAIGYFPTYALGNLIASQLWEKITKDIPNLENQIGEGQFEPLLSWLRENIHRHGAKFEPLELLERVLGSGLEAGPYVRYLETKFGDIYGL